MTRLRELLAVSDPQMSAIETHLDQLDHASRVVEIRSLARASQRRLYDLAAGFRPRSLTDIVPAAREPMHEVVHHGKNTLGVFTHFAKVFVRPDGPEGEAGELWGYNRTSGVISTAVGPGYFVLRRHEVVGELLVDYLRLPPRKPAAWPPILSNEARLSRFVYSHTQDILRAVSTHVTIGRATKNGKPMSAWFVLCRED